MFLADIAEFAEPGESSAALKDETDSRIPECALAADAELIVTGDKAMLALGSFRDIRVLSLRDYLDADAPPGPRSG